MTALLSAIPVEPTVIVKLPLAPSAVKSVTVPHFVNKFTPEYVPNLLIFGNAKVKFVTELFVVAPFANHCATAEKEPSPTLSSLATDPLPVTDSAAKLDVLNGRYTDASLPLKSIND